MTACLQMFYYNVTHRAGKCKRQIWHVLFLQSCSLFSFIPLALAQPWPPPSHSRPPTHCRHTFTSSGAEEEKVQPEPTVLDLWLQQEP